MKERLIELIQLGNSVHGKKLQRTLERNPEMSLELERYLSMYGAYMKAADISVEELANSYLSLLSQIMESRLTFARSGCYPASLHKEVVEKVYSDEKVMTRYMLGLGLSLFLWEHHYMILRFYRETISGQSYESVLEVGSGHGLFILDLLNRARVGAVVDVVDISRASLHITEGIISAVRPDKVNSLNFIENDVNHFRPEKKYRFIVMGEVLEHVQEPAKLLQGLLSLLDEKGAVFMSTCSNCPAVDHIYHFQSIEEIRSLVDHAGFAVTREIIAPSIDKPLAELEKRKVDVSYAAVLSRKGAV